MSTIYSIVMQINSSGLPDPNEAAVLMKFSNVSSLKCQIFDLAQQLNSYEFEVVPITFQTNDAKKALSDSSAWFTEIRKQCTVSNSEILTKSQGSTFMTVAMDKSVSKSVTFGTTSGCKRKLDKFSDTHMLADNFEHKKVPYQRKKANESDQERELRLENNRKVASCRKQKCQLGLKCNTISYQNKKKNETSKERKTRLTKNREYIKNYRKLKSQNCDNFEQNSAQMSTMTETSHFSISDCDKSDMEKTTYLSSFNKQKFGEIHDQPWAKDNMNRFHKSIQMKIHQCTICHEAWPIKFNPRKPDIHICSRCSKDKYVPKTFSYENKMIP